MQGPTIRYLTEGELAKWLAPPLAIEPAADDVIEFHPGAIVWLRAPEKDARLREHC